VIAVKMSKMYVNNKNKLNYRDRLRIVKQHECYRRKPSDLAKQYRVSRQTIHQILSRYKRDGLHGIEDHKPGRLETALNPKFYDFAAQLRDVHDYGAIRLQASLKRKGFSVSSYQLHKVIKLESTLRKKLGKRTKPKYVSYQADECNDLWHIDWSIDPLTKKKLLAIQDDRSRFIVFAGLFDEATAENSALGLQQAIKQYGAPKELVSDNGSHFKKPHSKKVVVEPLRIVEEAHQVKHIFIRPYYPQSNGKIERMFGSYKIEFPRMNHPKVKDCLSWMHYHNYERLHQSLAYDTPAEVYLGKCKANVI
jgi:putative transposase